MKIHDCVQGSQEWLFLRSAIPTASEFDQIITPGGKPSKSADGYMYRLLAEHCMGHPITAFVSWWMERGSKGEGDAVRFYELQTDQDTVPVGFITNDAETIGASPDRLVGESGLLEIKVPSEGVHMGYLLCEGGAYEAYKVQVQGQLWVTERQWVDVLSWHPELPPALVRIERDEAFIEKLSVLVTEFAAKLELKKAFVTNQGWRKSPEERTTSELEESIAILKRTLGSAGNQKGAGGTTLGEGAASPADYFG